MEEEKRNQLEHAAAARREKEAQVCLEATKDRCAPIAKAMVLSRAPDEALVVDFAGGLNSCDVVKQVDGVLVKTASRVGNHREEGDVKTLAIGLRKYKWFFRGPSMEGLA